MGTLEMQTKKLCTQSPCYKKNALRISRQTYNNQNSIKGAGGWYLVFTHGIEITAWTGNVSGIFYSNLPSWKWGDGFTFSASIFDPYFLLISFYFLWHIGPINCVMTTSEVSNVQEKGKLQVDPEN